MLTFLRKRLEWHGISPSTDTSLELNSAQRIEYHQVRLTSSSRIDDREANVGTDKEIWAFYVYTREAVFIFAPFRQVEIERIVECAMLRYIRPQDLVKKVLVRVCSCKAHGGGVI